MDYHKKRYLLLLTGLIAGNACLYAQDVVATAVEQLSALEGYIHTAEKGYGIARDGLHLIGDIRNGEKELHGLFFGSLKTVDDAVLDNSMLRVAYDEAAATVRVFNEAVRTYLASAWLQPEEKGYLSAVQDKVGGELQADLQALQTLSRDGSLSMTDGERLRHIRSLAMAIHDQYAGVKAYLTGVAWLIMERAKEQGYTGTLKTWYGIQ